MSTSQQQNKIIVSSPIRAACKCAATVAVAILLGFEPAARGAGLPDLPTIGLSDNGVVGADWNRGMSIQSTLEPRNVPGTTTLLLSQNAVLPPALPPPPYHAYLDKHYVKVATDWHSPFVFYRYLWTLVGYDGTGGLGTSQFNRMGTLDPNGSASVSMLVDTITYGVNDSHWLSSSAGVDKHAHWQGGDDWREVRHQRGGRAGEHPLIEMNTGTDIVTQEAFASGPVTKQVNVPMLMIAFTEGFESSPVPLYGSSCGTFTDTDHYPAWAELEMVDYVSSTANPDPVLSGNSIPAVQHIMQRHLKWYPAETLAKVFDFSNPMTVDQFLATLGPDYTISPLNGRKVGRLVFFQIAEVRPRLQQEENYDAFASQVAMRSFPSYAMDIYVPVNSGKDPVDLILPGQLETPGPITVVAGQSTPISGFDVILPSGAQDCLHVTIISTLGTLAVNDPTASGNGTSQVQISGTESQVEQALNSLVYTAGPDSGSELIRVSVMRCETGDSVSGTVFVTIEPSANECKPAPSGLIGWWRGEGTVADETGFNHGTMINNGEYAPGKIDYAFNLFGTNHVSVPDKALWAFGNNDFTLEFWVNFRTLGAGNQYIPEAIFIGSDEGSGTLKKWFFALWQGQLRFHINDPAQGPINLVNAPFSPTLNQWYHLAVVRNGNSFTAYINGTAAGSQTSTRAVPDAAAPLTIGQAEGIGFIDGKLDEVSIYGRALSASEVQGVYNASTYGKCGFACTPAPANLAAWWRMNGNGLDEAGQQNGSTQGNASFTIGKIQEALNLDGSSHLSVPDDDLWAFGTSDFTVEFSVNFRSLGTGSQYMPEAIFIGNDEGGGPTKKWFLSLWQRQLRFHINDPALGSVNLVNASFNPQLNRWYHIALVRSGNVFTAYVDGVSIGSQTSSRAVPNPNAPLTIGQAEGIGKINGRIDEIGIYTRALTAPEIRLLVTASPAGICQ